MDAAGGTESNPFAGKANSGATLTNDISHGDLRGSGLMLDVPGRSSTGPGRQLHGVTDRTVVGTHGEGDGHPDRPRSFH